jgi:hypothetical protein
MKISRVRIKQGRYAYVNGNIFESIFLYLKMYRRNSGLIPLDLMPRLVQKIGFLEGFNYVLIPRHIKNHTLISDELKSLYYK